MHEAGVRFIVDWLLNGRAPQVEPAVDGRNSLGISRRYRAWALLVVAFLDGLLAWSILTLRSEPAPLVLVLILFGPLAVIQTASTLDAFVIRWSIDSRGVHRRILGLGERTTPWLTIHRIELLRYLGFFRMRTGDGKSLYISVYRNGLATLATQLRQNLDRTPAADMIWVVRERAQNPDSRPHFYFNHEAAAPAPQAGGKDRNSAQKVPNTATSNEPTANFTDQPN